MPTGRQLTGGILGGLVGGLVFGMLMQAMGVMPIVAGLAGGTSVLEGWLVHGLISLITGVLFAVFFRGVAATYPTALLFGTLYGFLWWLLGPLTLMPLLMGMAPQYGAAFTPLMLGSLMGHLIFGFTLGLVYRAYTRAPLPMVIQ